MTEKGQSLKAMLVNVGGAYTPAIHTLNLQKPRFICFFVSPESKKAIRENILPALTYEYEHYDWIETHAAQSLLECFRCLAENLPKILEKWGVLPSELGVEYTAGTKPMSVAAMLATVKNSSQYFYVGSKDPSGRDRDGVGVVLDGKEFSWFQTNPWEEMAVQARQEIALLFNASRFADAEERVRQLSIVAPLEMKKVYDALADLIKGYALWDRFDYKEAQQFIGRALQSLRLYAAGSDDPIRTILDQVEKHVQFLGDLTGKDTNLAHSKDILDLLANAIRRAEKAQRYDDAVARLYSALEGIARYRLLEMDIQNGKVKPEQIPAEFREQYCQRYGNGTAADLQEIKLGLDASYQLLNDLGNELGKKYFEKEMDLEKVLNARNQSRLAHGKNPIRPEVYEKMRDILLDFVHITPEDLPQFPVLKL